MITLNEDNTVSLPADLTEETTTQLLHTRQTARLTAGQIRAITTELRTREV